MSKTFNRRAGMWYVPMRNAQFLLACVVLSACQPTPPPPSSAQIDLSRIEQGAAKTRDAMTLIPAGPFLMGSDKKDDQGLQQRYGFVKPIYLDEHPPHRVNLPAFYIDTYEVTNAQYLAFVRKTERAEPFLWTQNGYNLIPERLQNTDLQNLRWIAGEYFKLDMDTQKMDKPQLLAAMQKDQAVKDAFPVAYVNWQDADAYCHWVGKRLPSEQEWEKAARGAQGQEFPWGNEWQEDITNTGDNSDFEDGVAPIGSYPKNKSPYGVFDMAGNVWEWVADWYQPYPGSDYKNSDFGQTKKIIRGGGGGIGHYSIPIFFRGATRQYADPTLASGDVGFRCARDAK